MSYRTRQKTSPDTECGGLLNFHTKSHAAFLPPLCSGHDVLSPSQQLHFPLYRSGILSSPISLHHHILCLYFRALVEMYILLYVILKGEECQGKTRIYS